MGSRHVMLALVAGILFSTVAAADTKIVQQVHQDAFTVMGQSQPASDGERVMWFGGSRLRVDEGSSTVIVRLDAGLLYLIDHTQKTVSSVELPIDLETLLPEGVAEQMGAMLRLETTVSPTDETRQVGPWTARGWRLTMTTPVVTVENTLWATEDLDIDRAGFDRLFGQILSLQPGTESLIDSLGSVDGFVVEQQSVTTMAGTPDAAMKRTERTVSVETADPPPGTYDPPAGYSSRQFDLMAMLQGGG